MSLPDALGPPSPAWPDSTPLGGARDFLRDEVWRNGADCPCCTQNAKVYKRKLPYASGVVMVRLWHIDEGRHFVKLGKEVLDKVKGTAHQGGYGTYAHHWNLMEQEPSGRPDGSNRSGWWRLTDLGREFVQRRCTVPQHAWIYSNRCLMYEGPMITISDVFKTRFHYDEMMRGV